MTLPRKYAKWVRKSTGLHPSFEPSRRVDVGDYGYTDPNTGQFLSEGNIFDPREDGKSIAELLGIEVVENSGEVFHKFTSTNASVVEVIPDAHLGVPATDISAGFKVSFKKGGAAALIFLHGTLRSMRHEGRLRDSFFDRIFGNTKLVVTCSWTAPTYIFCISNKHEQTFTVNLQASIPLLGAASPGGRFSTTFKLNSSSDYLQVGPPITADLVGSPQDLTRFHPLFKLKNTSQLTRVNAVVGARSRPRKRDNSCHALPSLMGRPPIQSRLVSRSDREKIKESHNLIRSSLGLLAADSSMTPLNWVDLLNKRKFSSYAWEDDVSDDCAASGTEQPERSFDQVQQMTERKAELNLSNEILANNHPSEDGTAYSTVENGQSLLTFVETGNGEPDTSLDNRLVSDYLDPRMEVLKQLKISLALYQAVVD